MKPHLSARGDRFNRTRRVRFAGFTLIEILVVVAIIALLISILLPSLKRARDQAKVTACLAHLHDLGTSHMLYAHDNPPYFPLPQYMASPDNGGCMGCDDNLFVLWYRKYAKNAEIWTCPATKYQLRTPERVDHDPAVNTRNGVLEFIPTTKGVLGRNEFAIAAQWAAPGNQFPGYGTSYEYNGWLDSACVNGNSTKVKWHPDYVSRSPIPGAPKTTRNGKPRPDFMVLMHDADEGGDVLGGPRNPPGAINNYPEPWDNHGKYGLNILFGDGHTLPIRRWDLGPTVSRIWARDTCQ